AEYGAGKVGSLGFPPRIRWLGFPSLTDADLQIGLDTPHGGTLDVAAGCVYWVDTGTNRVTGSKGGKALSRGRTDGQGEFEVLVALDEPWDVVLDTRIENYADFKERHFGKDEPATGPEEDADQDQRSNLLEYAFADRPNEKSQGKVIEIRQSENAIAFRHPTLATDLTHTVEISRDLVTWTSNSPGQEDVDRILSQKDFGDGTTEKVAQPVDLTHPVHIRVRASLKP
ncbi:MAG: hypothetical protein AAF514_14055, partial [Verrucomicrobiota bacterium]